MKNRHIVLDTNCLLQSISHRSGFYRVWKDFLLGRYYLCVTNDILEEYEEMIAKHTSTTAAHIAIETILRANNVIRIDARYHFGLITKDPDDNKFVDCAIAANADFIVSEDKHFHVLKSIPFPHVEVIRLRKFLQELSENDIT